jgi:hypothetical protein
MAFMATQNGELLLFYTHSHVANYSCRIGVIYPQFPRIRKTIFLLAVEVGTELMYTNPRVFFPHPDMPSDMPEKWAAFCYISLILVLDIGRHYT